MEVCMMERLNHVNVHKPPKVSIEELPELSIVLNYHMFIFFTSCTLLTPSLQDEQTLSQDIQSHLHHTIMFPF